MPEVAPLFTPGAYAQGSVGNPLAPPATVNPLLLFSENLHGELYRLEAEAAQSGFFDFFAETPGDQATRLQREKEENQIQLLAVVAVGGLITYLLVKGK